jgi:hypothetical protein
MKGFEVEPFRLPFTKDQEAFAALNGFSVSSFVFTCHGLVFEDSDVEIRHVGHCAIAAAQVIALEVGFLADALHIGK